jgi:putative phosphoribosyl transferase
MLLFVLAAAPSFGLAASADPARVRAIVSRGGRPDLPGDRLRAVRAQTPLIVGGADTAVLELNRRALADLPSGSRLEVVRGATHLFEEPGAMGAVSALAGDWFGQWLEGPPNCRGAGQTAHTARGPSQQ